MNISEPKKPRGRPSAFNYDEALQKALMVFWSRGYEGASMAELTEAMGINRPSIYAAYGNKEELFCKALEKYMVGPTAYVAAAMREPTARQVVEAFLTKSAEFLADENTPRGCMIAIGSLFSGADADQVKQALIAYRRGYETALKERFDLAKSQNDLHKSVNTADLAKYVATVHQGMSVQATGDATKEELLAVVHQALKNWPT
ncbi:TetR family transcriptional regulator [Novimethylophilus kurashikiensis]|uniref:TetR family transcriptional regulator n=1 Tax=Novimethylophilus kurashikiensis TaxID=1825523 RepID=A0A2R5F7L4_9PROT|nr:TetR/AcrR family transcriptional regulator [Novimethylophilus kurashikiensis]GBG12671.1 TetR family transcriptional regulator [Novimethylophilus kurashikiensis]